MFSFISLRKPISQFSYKHQLFTDNSTDSSELLRNKAVRSKTINPHLEPFRKLFRSIF